jgi:hypothetical protein
MTDEGTRLLTTDPDRLTVLLRDARADANLMEHQRDEARARVAQLEAVLNIIASGFKGDKVLAEWEMSNIAAAAVAK